MFVPALSAVTDQAMRSYADTPWPELVDELRSPRCGRWSPAWAGCSTGAAPSAALQASSRGF